MTEQRRNSDAASKRDPFAPRTEAQKGKVVLGPERPAAFGQGLPPEGGWKRNMPEPRIVERPKQLSTIRWRYRRFYLWRWLGWRVRIDVQWRRDV